MENILFGINYVSAQETLIKTLLFLGMVSILIYLIFFLLTKLMNIEDVNRKEIQLRLIFLWSVFAVFILFNVYLFFLFYQNGHEEFQWESPVFYLGILSHIIIYLIFPVIFFIQRGTLNNLINGNSIN
ncbi:hypothetical protein IM793_22905 [Pedobacter sp. MR2016-19]|uniref:hypothetical protein n=1 Tax=Pedobacter sp. MR2016-19 TaxID=2780089 RepID=UPI0018735B88|nr:hypothetical protein [Pedobacter sp. MR2016-19]MBE5322023.1 hypothetical protein [Pedobacter sp. MR2016-19]